MPVIILLFLLLILDQRTQPVRTESNISIALPLAVRSPHLSYWLPQLNGGGNATNHPRLSKMVTNYGLSQAQNWQVFVRVDRSIYVLIGSPGPGLDWSKTNVENPAIINTVRTPTRIIYTAAVGPMEVNLTFMNPVEPRNWVKQSIPFSYLSFTARSLDNSTHNLQVYSDLGPITGVLTRPSSGNVYMNVTSNTDVIYHSYGFWDQTAFSEAADQPMWGTLYYAMKNETGVTYSAGEIFDVYDYFELYGGLDNQPEGGGTDILVGYTTVVGFSRDLGTIQVTQSPIVWAIGYTVDPAINYPAQVDPFSTNARSPYYKLKYPDDESLIVDFLNDFDNASIRCQELDQKILQDAASVSDLLGDLVSFAVPQVFGSTQLTIGTDSNGKLNESDVMMFMKNVGGDIPGRINAVETLYAAFPALMYIDPTLGTPLLEPLFPLQADYDSRIRFAAKDLGLSYPNVSASRSIHDQGVEQTGNMLIMTYASARASGDGALISRYYSVLSSWADYLASSSLSNATHTSIDDWERAREFVSGIDNNVAIKGIIAIAAMSKMSSAAGHVADANKYSDTAARLYRQWKAVAFDDDQHLYSVDNARNTWTLGYNLFADAWLDTNVVESSVYDIQSNFLVNFSFVNDLTDPLLHGVVKPIVGLPVDDVYSEPNSTLSSSELFILDTPSTDAVLGWNLFVAAMTPNNDLLLKLIRAVHHRASFFGNQSLGAFPLRYNFFNGSDMSGIGNPAQGAMFAPLYRKIPVQDIQFSATTPGPQPKISNKPSHIHALPGAVISTVTILVLAAVIVAFLWYRRKLNTHKSSASSSEVIETSSGIVVTPFVPSRPIITNGGPVPWMDQQQLHSGLPVTGTVEAGADAYHSSSSRPPSGLDFQSFPFVPVGLSDKELAQIRAETLRSQLAVAPPGPVLDESGQQHPSVPVGLSAKELARMRAETLHSQNAVANPVLDETETRPPSPPSEASPASTTEPSATTLPPIFQALQTQVDRLWGEMRQLQGHAERSNSEAPPSYMSQNGGTVQP